LDIDYIRELVKFDRIKLSKEARKRMVQRNVSFEQIEKAISRGRIIRREPKTGPYPKCTILGYVEREIAGLMLPEPQPLNVACAVGEELHIITLYWE